VNAEAAMGESARDRSGIGAGLSATRVNRVLVAGVVISLFLERFERVEGEGTYPILPIPDLFFLTAIGILAAKVALDLLRGRVALRRLGWKDLLLGGFVALLGVLSLLSVVTQPETVTSGIQVVKTFSHLVVLLGAALVLGHALSKALVTHAMHVYFAGAVAVAALGIVQAVDQNVVKLGIADALHLISRPGAEGFLRPCSIFSEPAYLGYFSLGGIMVGLLLISERHRIVGAVGCGVCAVGLLLAAAAGPLAVALPLGLYALVFHRRLLGRGIAPTLAGVAIVAALIWFLTPVNDTVIYRAESISSGQDASLELRTELNKGSVEVWKSAPLTGVGLGNSRRHLSREVEVSWAPGATIAFNSANAYVNLLGESGPFAVAGLLAVLVALWWRSRTAPPRLEELTSAFIVLLALQFLVINPLIMPAVWFWAGQRLALQDD